MNSFVWPVNKPTEIISGNINKSITCIMLMLSSSTALNNQWVGNQIVIQKFDSLILVTFDGSKAVTVKSNLGSLAIGFDIFGI